VCDVEGVREVDIRDLGFRDLGVHDLGVRDVESLFVLLHDEALGVLSLLVFVGVVFMVMWNWNWCDPGWCTPHCGALMLVEEAIVVQLKRMRVRTKKTCGCVVVDYLNPTE